MCAIGDRQNAFGVGATPADAHAGVAVFLKWKNYALKRRRSAARPSNAVPSNEMVVPPSGTPVTVP